MAQIRVLDGLRAPVALPIFVTHPTALSEQSSNAAVQGRKFGVKGIVKWE